MTGAARAAQETRERAESIRSDQEIERKKREFEHSRATAEARIVELRAKLASDQQELQRVVSEHEARRQPPLPIAIKWRIYAKRIRI